ncbi:MAG: 1-(5-phosphoribosyl)-5-[(5-phosphoribosylamino)methylideneamino]imidazole-4-carboxamide isomerase [Clostridia bacterium]|nr:1-(5-phosphoribosyl)-5-[(5-phosphoribosylamino)methylideneamino]imidazole-4-carboxamide isomerase [Clostridia bacterium]
MKIFPAIDIFNKKAVRLYNGDYSQMTVYNENPTEVAKDFSKSGAEYVHIVDLEGAKYGNTPNIDIVSEIVKNTNLFCEIGGGIRNINVVDKYINTGISRVIIGTAAVENRDFLIEAIAKYGNKIAVGADVKDGFIAIKGWTEKSKVTLEDFLTDMQSLGVDTVICTDISKDGAMNGTNLELYSSLSKKFSLNITASGGVSGIEDIKKLCRMGIYGAIIGKAYYTGAVDLKEVLEVANDY